MPEKVVPGPICEERSIREAVCIHTKKIFDSCKEKDLAALIPGEPAEKAPISKGQTKKALIPAAMRRNRRLLLAFLVSGLRAYRARRTKES